MYVHYLSIVAVAATFTVASALAQNAPPNLAKPNPQAAQETPKSDRRVPELQFRAWKEELAAHIEKYKHYPAGRPEGDAVIRFVLDQKGHVVSVEVARSSGNAVIDEAALAIVRRADPMPQPPKFVTAADLTFVLPFRFRCDPRSAAAGLC